jgi:hypothetical protein
MSTSYTPEQSLGGGLPPEFITGVRLIGVCTHNTPPWNAEATRPLVPIIKRPAVLLSVLTPRTTKPALAPTLDVPDDSIDGVQPSELILAVQ